MGWPTEKLYYLVTVRLTFDYLYLSEYGFFLFFKIQAKFWPCFSEIDLFGFMAPFGSSLKMILVVLSSLSFGDHFNLKTDCDPMMQRSSSANFYLMQDLVSFAPLSKTWSEDRSGTGSYLAQLLNSLNVIQSTPMTNWGHRVIPFTLSAPTEPYRTLAI